MTKKEKEQKADEVYYQSICVTPAEYRATVALAKKHHQHIYKTRFSLGIAFYECACGDRAVTAAESE